jgi:hypothetical protein
MSIWLEVSEKDHLAAYSALLAIVANRQAC